MQQIKYGRTLASAQVRFRQRYTALLQTAVSSIGGVLLRYERDGIIPVEFADDVARQAGEIVQAVFVVDGRTSIRADGVPVSPYARALMTEIVLVTIEVVNKHADFMRRHLPDDVAWMLQQPARTIAELAHLRVGYPTTDHFQIFEAEDKRLTDEELERLRLFAPNPLAEYEPPHTWVDPNGYILSQRIWNNSQEVRRKLDAFLYDQIREGRGAREIARSAEQFLLPGRARIRTRKPYGSDASYDAMRLARTEISHAHNNAAWVSATLNPYVSQIRMMRSASGDATCKVCPTYAGPVGGAGIAYSVYSAVIAPYHPNCVTPGQFVNTVNGMIPIEDIQAGDLVLTDKGRYRAVIDAWHRPYKGKVYFIETDAGTFELTSNHPVLTSQGWINAELVKLGEQVLYTSPSVFFDVGANVAECDPSKGTQIVIPAFISDDLRGRRVPSFTITFDSDAARDDGKINLIFPDTVLSGVDNAGIIEGLSHKSLNTGRFSISAVSENGGDSGINAGVMSFFGNRNLLADFGTFSGVVIPYKVEFRDNSLEHFASHLGSCSVVILPLKGNCFASGTHGDVKIIHDVTKHAVSDTELGTHIRVLLLVDDVEFFNDLINGSIEFNFNSQDVPFNHAQSVSFGMMSRASFELLLADGTSKHDNLLLLSPKIDMGHTSGNVVVGQVANLSQAPLHYSTVRKITERHYDDLVYNMQVDEDESYTVNGAVVHNCMCYSVPEVTDSPQAVTERLRAGLIDAENQYLKPFLTPVQTQAFIDMLMGWDTWQDLLAQTLVGQPQPRLF